MIEPDTSGVRAPALVIAEVPDNQIKRSEPVNAVSHVFVLLYAVAYTGIWLALLTPMLVTIAVRVRQLAPANAASQLAWVLGIGAIFALVGNPVFGRMSDRTVSRYGMRRPWLIGGMICGTAAYLIMALAPNVPLVIVGWCLAQLAFNAVLAAAVAILPDQVPAHQRGTVSGVLGMCMPIGQVGGTFLVQALPDSMLLRFLVPSVIGAVCVFLLAIVLPDRRLHPSQRPAKGLRNFLGSFWLDPSEHPSFFWAWLSRFLLVTGTAFLTTYQSYYLIDKLGYSVEQVPTLIFKGMLVQAVTIVIASVLSGRASDASGRRKIYVMVAAAVYGTGLWIIAAAQAYPSFLIGMALTGIGQGVFFAVELALVTQILPDRELNAAKDLGMFNIANTLPQSVAPLLGPMILSLSHGNYTWLFVVAGGIAFLSSVAITPLREVR
ncbi:MAG: MFS transporter [Povalibacter sp.]|jgi:MFS family permease